MARMNSLYQGASRLPHLGVIRAQGPDAASFLHGQLTQDLLSLDASHARLAAYCNAKGRVLASFVVLRPVPDEVWLVLSRELLAPTLKRLSMFVLRAKVRLSDASAEVDVWGLVEPVTPSSAVPWTCQSAPDGAQGPRVALYPALGHARALWLAHPGAMPAHLAELPAGVWDWLEVQSGVATVTQGVVEALVPQMLNFESVGGVNFKKGCYPGQEVVARSQFRGTLKRRTYLAHACAPMQPGQEVVQAGDPSQPCGLVVQAAANPAGGWDALVAMQISAFDAGDVHLSGGTDTALQLSAPPYPLLADV